MPTNIIDAKAFREDGDLLTVAVQDNDTGDPQYQPFEMTVLRGMTMDEMGQVALDQPLEKIPDPVFDGSFEIIWHWHEIIDPETGVTIRSKILDSITKL